MNFLNKSVYFYKMYWYNRNIIETKRWIKMKLKDVKVGMIVVDKYDNKYIVTEVNET